MIETQTETWEGASGTQYTYYVYPLPHSFAENKGNYIFARIGAGKWVPIYIGEGDLKDRVSNPDQGACIDSKGASHIHARLNENEQSRKAEESDLLAGHPEAYVPNGCNVKPGG